MITPRPLWLLPPVLTVTGIRNGLPRALPGQPYKLERSAFFCSGKCPKEALHALTQHYVAGALAASSALTMSNQPRRGIAILLPASAVTSASFRASLCLHVCPPEAQVFLTSRGRHLCLHARRSPH